MSADLPQRHSSGEARAPTGDGDSHSAQWGGALGGRCQPHGMVVKGQSGLWEDPRVSCPCCCFRFEKGGPVEERLRAGALLHRLRAGWSLSQDPVVRTWRFGARPAL